MHYIANTNRQLRHRLTTSVMYVLFADRDVAIHAMQCNAMTIMGTGASLYAHILLTIMCTKTLQFML